MTAGAWTSVYSYNLNGNLSFATINVLTSDFMEKSHNTRVLATAHGILIARGFNEVIDWIEDSLEAIQFH